MQDHNPGPIGQAGPSGGRFGHVSKPSNSDTGFSHGAFNSNISGFADRHPRRGNIPTINTQSVQAQPVNVNPGLTPGLADLTTPGSGFDMQFTPLLPSQLLLGSPFQPGTPAAFANGQFQNMQYQQAQQNNQQQQQQNGLGSPVQQPMSPGGYQTMVSPSTYGAPQFFAPQSPTAGYSNMGGQMQMQMPGSPVAMSPVVSGTSRTVYLGNIPQDTPADEILGHVRSGQIESVRLLPDKNCAFISFLDASSATHFHSDAILKKLCIKGQDIKVGWGKPSQVPTSVALAVQQSGASRNVYLGNLSEEVSDDEIREDLGKFGAIDTIKIVREKNIAFVHFLSIANAIKAVSQLPQEPKWQAPRRVYYGKDRCAYVSKTQQQNAAQYLGIAPGYAHMLTGADRDLISSALAQQSVAAAAVATTAGGINNLGNRTIYLGNIHPETTIEEICNVVRGGLLHHIRYIPDKHICFVTFITSSSSGLLAPLGEEPDLSPPRDLVFRWHSTCYENFIPERRRKLQMAVEEHWMEEGSKAHTKCGLGNNHYHPGKYGSEGQHFGGYAGYAAIFDHFQTFLWCQIICGEEEHVSHEFLQRVWGCNWYDEYEESEADMRQLRDWAHIRRLYAEKHQRVWHTCIRRRNADLTVHV